MVTPVTAEESENPREAAVEQISAIESLTKSRAWGMLVAFIETQTTRRMNQIMLTPVKTGEDAAEQNFVRGECAGLNLVKAFIEDQLQISQETVELYKQQAKVKGEL